MKFWHWDWLWSRNERERSVKDAADKLQMGMRTTAKCRYNAAGRLNLQTKFAFWATIGPSLGLVFIALIQNSGVPLAFKANVLNMMQIFFSVAVLVYSVVISTARYEIRSTQLTECGDRLKALSREMDREQSISPSSLTDFQKRYNDIVTDVENHIPNDYRFATLEMTRDYFVTGIPRFTLWTRAWLEKISGFFVPLMLLGIEFLFICDMVGATSIFTDYLNGNAVAFKLAK
jgi:hypothetical protein